MGSIAGWPPHKNVEESLGVIKNVFTGAECYAICEKGSNKAIGAIELKLNGHTDMTEGDDECELGYWLGKPFWGRGYVPEAAKEILRHGFEYIGMTTIWCGYYNGNVKSKRVQEKVGFAYHHTCEEVPVPLMNEIRMEVPSLKEFVSWIRRKKTSPIVKRFKNPSSLHPLNRLPIDYYRLLHLVSDYRILPLFLQFPENCNS